MRSWPAMASTTPSARPFAFEHRPLFRWELEIAECRGIEDSRGQIGGVEAEVCGSRRRHLPPLRSVRASAARRVRLRVRDCREWLGEAHALFLREADDFEVEGQLVQRNPSATSSARATPGRRRGLHRTHRHSQPCPDESRSADAVRWALPRVIRRAYFPRHPRVLASRPPASSRRVTHERGASKAREKVLVGLALALGTKRQFATTGDDLLRPLCCCRTHDLLPNALKLSASTRASMCPDGSSVGTKDLVGMSCPKRDRSTSRQCLLA